MIHYSGTLFWNYCKWVLGYVLTLIYMKMSFAWLEYFSPLTLLIHYFTWVQFNQVVVPLLSTFNVYPNIHTMQWSAHHQSKRNLAFRESLERKLSWHQLLLWTLSHLSVHSFSDFKKNVIFLDGMQHSAKIT